MSEFYEFVKWCFTDPGSSLITIIVLGVIFDGLAKVIKSFRKPVKIVTQNDKSKRQDI